MASGKTDEIPQTGYHNPIGYRTKRKAPYKGAFLILCQKDGKKEYLSHSGFTCKVYQCVNNLRHLADE